MFLGVGFSRCLQALVH